MTARLRATVVAGLIALTLLCGSSLFAQPRPTYYPIPAGFDFPANQATLLQYVDAGDVASMRQHAWNVFAGLTQPTPSGEAVWETWYSADETFGTSPQLQGVRRVQRRFRSPRQFQRGTLHPQAVGASLLSFTLFNDQTRSFIRSSGYNLQTTLTSINQSFPSTTPVAQRSIKEFPNGAMSLKTVWWVVKASSLTALPVWDPDLNPVLPGGNGYQTWKRVVAVDPASATVAPGTTTTVNFLGKPFPNSVVVPMSRFYGFKISQNELAGVRANAKAPGAKTAQIGDYAVLVAMHYTTKEIPQWVWATVWWHDKPDAGPYAADRPDTVKGAWRNYLMSTTYNMDKPPAPDHGPPIAFNPWLEAPFNAASFGAPGITSNCMACHQEAIWPSDGTFTVRRGSMKPDDPAFMKSTKLDFLWSIVDESQ